jgi:ubiquinone/menaquinone biosynthesis C-methylase UbiE
MCNSTRLLAPYVREGMTVLEPGPGMGFFTLELARLVGTSGHVVAVDIQPKMLEGLKRRANRARLVQRIETRLISPEAMHLSSLAGKVDFILAYAMVHELPDRHPFFTECAGLLKAGGAILLVEPGGHVSEEKFDTELQTARDAGLLLSERLSISRSHAALLSKA